MDIDRPARDLDRVIDGRADAERLFRKGRHDIGGDPWRAEAGGDVGRLQVFRQGFFEGGDVAPIALVERRGGRGQNELAADFARQIGVGLHPNVAILSGGPLGIEKNALAEFGDRCLARAAQ